MKEKEGEVEGRGAVILALESSVAWIFDFGARDARDEGCPENWQNVFASRGRTNCWSDRKYSLSIRDLGPDTRNRL